MSSYDDNYDYDDFGNPRYTHERVRDTHLNQRTLDITRAGTQAFIADSAMTHHVAGYRMAIEQAINGAVLTVEREIHQDVLPADEVVYPVTVETPWTVWLPVTLPHTWWRRLLRRPPRRISVHAKGYARGKASVVVQSHHFARYPDMPPVPAGWGRPVQVTERTPVSDYLGGEHQATVVHSIGVSR